MKTEHIIDWVGYTIDSIHLLTLIALLGGMVYLLYKEIVSFKN